MARYQVILAYDGTHFKGSQRQANYNGSGSSNRSVSRPRTVQGEFEKALRKLGWCGRSILMAGRTDTGVHAVGQVAAFDLDWHHTEHDLLKALNSGLPSDLAVREAAVVAADFHPRFDARSRCYRYRLFCEPVRDPLRERFAWRAWPVVDGDALKKNASLFLGAHDFADFGSPTSPKGSTVRAVTGSEWRQFEDEWQYEVEADAFLYRMVRRLVFVQVAIAQGRLSVEVVARSLARQAKSAARSRRVEPVETVSKGRGRNKPSSRASRAIPAGLAPAHGLTLVEVTY